MYKDPFRKINTQWLREQDSNLRPSGYEPDELPDCSIPRQSVHIIHTSQLQINIGTDGRTRTGTALGHHPLKVACLPIPPHRHTKHLTFKS